MTNQLVIKSKHIRHQEQALDFYLKDQKQKHKYIYYDNLFLAS